MGTVYRVSDLLQEGKVLALKTLAVALERSDLVEYLRREFRILTQLDHPNLVQVYDYGSTLAGDFYLTMEYVPGQDLRQTVQREGAATTLPLMVQTCRALAYLHTRQIVHGDLKPEHVLVVGQQVKLVDFGIAVDLRGGGGWSTHGTRGYTAPETRQRHQVDHRSDLYGLGAMWYDLLVGEPPSFFVGHDRLTYLTLREALAQQPQVPPIVAEIVTKLLATSPDERYESANQVIEAINRGTGSRYALETQETAASYALRGRFVGRQAEMAALETAWQQAQQAGAQLVLVGGASGVGKSRLVEEFSIQAKCNGAWVVQGQCIESGGSAYQPWRRILRTLVRYLESAAAPLQERLRRRLVPLLPELHSPSTHKDADPFFLPARNSQAEQARLHGAIAQVIRQVAAMRPMLLVVEDAHWADKASLDLLDFLARDPALSNLLLCVTYRQDEIADDHLLAALSGRSVQRVTLRGLPSTATLELVRSLLGLQHLPAVLREQVQRITAGNTFFVQELIRSLIESQRMLRRAPNGWQIDESALAQLSLPATIQQAIERRLTRLSPLARRALQVAAVIGPVFWDGAVSDIGRLSPDQLQDALHDLLDMDLIVEQAVSTLGREREYRIQHITVRNVVHENIPTWQRKHYHERAAHWFVAHLGDRAVEMAGQIAGHYEQAGALAQAAEWYAQAGKHALDTYAPEMAVRYYRRSLALMPESESALRRTAVYDGLGRAYLKQARLSDALEAYTVMRAIAKAAGSLPAQVRAGIGQSHVQAVQGDLEAALGNIEQVLELARERPETHRELTQALLGKGWILHRLNRSTEALPCAEQAWTRSETIHDPVLMVRSLLLLGGVHSTLGHTRRTVRAHEQALALCRELKNSECLGVVYNNLGVAAEDEGAYETAADYYRKAVDLARETEHYRGEILYLNNLGGVLVRLGEHQAAIRVLRDVIRRQKDSRWFAFAHTYCALAEALLAQGHPEEALQAARHAWTLATHTRQRLHLGATWRVLGMIAAQMAAPVEIQGQPMKAEDCFAASLRLLTEIGAEQERSLTLQAWAQYEVERGDRERGAGPVCGRERETGSISEADFRGLGDLGSLAEFVLKADHSPRLTRWTTVQREQFWIR